MMNEQEAYSHLIDIIRSPALPQLGCYGCDFYLPYLAADFVRKHNPELGTITPEHPRVKELLPNFQDAASTLCRMGILRSGPATDQQTSVVGLGFSLTNQGRKWSQQQDKFIYQSPSHFSEILAKYEEIFGDGFRQRAQEACSAYLAGCYLSTCVMCGAAAESIVLNLMIQRDPENEQKIVNRYESSGGTRAILKDLVGQLKADQKNRLEQLNDLLKYRRDSSGHGKFIQIDEFDAYDSLSRLIKLSTYIKDNLSDILNRT